MSVPAGDHAPSTATTASSPEQAPWHSPHLPPEERVQLLLDAMTPAEKIGQLSGVWLDTPDAAGEVAPLQQEMTDTNFDWKGWISTGLGHLTRPFGSAPVAPSKGAQQLTELQQQAVAANRFGIPALTHEECLTGLAAWQATIFPTPLAWGATFNRELVATMASHIAESMRMLGVHQGLAPVLDVTRDPRWGRTEETIGEDPYLVATLGTAYVQGLQRSGVHATLKHFAGYSASRAARNFGPVSLGPREFAELLFPFEMAVRTGHARSVMASYTAVDGVPSHADTELLTGLLRQNWGFAGVVVADYFGVSFLHTLHHLVAGRAQAAHRALSAGLDVELPMVNCFGEPLFQAVETGEVAEPVLDQAVRRVLLQKCELGLLDPDWDPTPPALRSQTVTGDGPQPETDLDPPEARDLAREVAAQSVVLLANNGQLPLSPQANIALVGPLADDSAGMLGCYTFPRHVGQHHPGLADGVAIPTVLESLRAELPQATITHVTGCAVSTESAVCAPETTEDLAAAVRAAQEAEVCVAVLGDYAGLFGTGTSGEGCDVADLSLPGRQGELLEALAATTTPVVVVLLSGRPYALGATADQLAAVVQAFFPGEEGATAVAGILAGNLNPSGRLPVSMPRLPGAQPNTYLAPRLGHHSDVSSVDPTPLFPFGHGLSYTTFTWRDVQVNAAPPEADQPPCLPIRGTTRLSVRVGNSGTRSGTEVVQLYLHRPVAEVTQPLARLIGYARVALEPAEERRVEFHVPTDLLAIADRHGQWVHTPGPVEFWLAASSTDIRGRLSAAVAEPSTVLPSDRELHTTTVVR